VSDIKALVVGELSLVEQRNVEQLEAWAIACTVPGGSAARLVDEVYADQPEVVSVLTGTYVARVGLSKRPCIQEVTQSPSRRGSNRS
jgi:hypothetical protein